MTSGDELLCQAWRLRDCQATPITQTEYGRDCQAWRLRKPTRDVHTHVKKGRSGITTHIYAGVQYEARAIA